MKMKRLIEAAHLLQTRGPSGELAGRVDVFRGGTFSARCGEDCLMLYPLRELGFKERRDLSDGGARSVFVDEDSGAIFTYCEGDLTLEVPHDSLAGARLLQRTEQFYLEEEPA